MKARRALRRRRGEVAVFDIVLFVPLMLVALLFLDAVVSTTISTVPENVNSSRYAWEGLTTTLGASISTTGYIWIYPCNPYFCYSPCATPYAGCWDAVQVGDVPVSYMIDEDVYLVSCHAVDQNGNVITQATLDATGNMGWSIMETAQAVALGERQGGTEPTTYQYYSFQFNGTATGFAQGCNTIDPMRAIDENGMAPPNPTTQVYTWSTTIPAVAYFSTKPVLVQMAFWGP